VAVNSSYSVFASFGDFSSVFLVIGDNNRNRIEITFLSLEAETHIEIMVIFCIVFFYWKTIWAYDVFKPWMTEDFRNGYSFLWLYNQHSSYEILSFWRYLNWKLDVIFHLTLIKTLHRRGFERNCALKHNIEHYSK